MITTATTGFHRISSRGSVLRAMRAMSAATRSSRSPDHQAEATNTPTLTAVARATDRKVSNIRRGTLPPWVGDGPGSARHRDVLVGLERLPFARRAIRPVDPHLGPVGGAEPEVGGTEVTTGVPSPDHHLPLDPIAPDPQLDPRPDRVAVGAVLGQGDTEPVPHLSRLLPHLDRHAPFDHDHVEVAVEVQVDECSAPAPVHVHQPG